MTISRMLVPTDFSPPSDAALAYARMLAARLDAAIHLLHVCEDPSAGGPYAINLYAPTPAGVQETLRRRIEAQLAERLPDAPAARAVTALATGSAPPEILDYATRHGIDLIVMGTHGRTGLSHLLLGSVAEHVVRLAPCPVLTVRHAGGSKQ